MTECRGKKLLLLGGGHAHLLTLAGLEWFSLKGIDVTVVQPSPYHYYSGLGPAVLGGRYDPGQIRFATRSRVEQAGGRFIEDRAIHIDPHRQLVKLEATEEELFYDVLSLNLGSVVKKGPAVSGEVCVEAKPIEKLIAARQKLVSLAKYRPLRIAVVGGGPSALEIGGNIESLLHGIPGGYSHQVTIYCGGTILPGRPARLVRLATRHLTARGIRLRDSGRVMEIDNHRLWFADGSGEEADCIFLCSGVQASPVIADSGLPTGPDGGLVVNRFLQSTGFSNIFGGGDCIHFRPQPLDKVGVYAVRQNPVLLHNLKAHLSGTPLRAFVPGSSYLLIYNLGRGYGLFARNRLVFGGRLAFWLKDLIDRRFMARFSD